MGQACRRKGQVKKNTTEGHGGVTEKQTFLKAILSFPQQAA